MEGARGDCLEPGKEGCKEGQDRVENIFCLEPGNEGSKGIGVLSLNQERKDARRGRIGLKI